MSAVAYLETALLVIRLTKAIYKELKREPEKPVSVMINGVLFDPTVEAKEATKDEKAGQ